MSRRVAIRANPPATCSLASDTLGWVTALVHPLWTDFRAARGIWLREFARPTCTRGRLAGHDHRKPRRLRRSVHTGAAPCALAPRRYLTWPSRSPGWSSPRPVDYINTSIGVATATLFMIEASMHVPPDYAMFIPSAMRKAVDLPVVGVGRFKDPLQAERALAEGTPISSVSSAGRSPTPTSWPRPGRGDGGHPPLPVVQPGVRGADGAQPLARLHREPPDRSRGDHAGSPTRRRGPERCSWSAPDPAACRRRSPPARQALRRGPRARRRGRGPGATGGQGAQPRRVRRPLRNQVNECQRLG